MSAFVSESSLSQPVAHQRADRAVDVQIGAVGATETAKKREMVEDLAAALADRTDDDGRVVFPIESLVLTAVG